MTALDGAITECMGLSIFSGISRTGLKELFHGGQVVTSAHREHLFEVGDSASFFGVVLSGAYKLSKPSAVGEDVIVHFSTPGDVVAAFIIAMPNTVYPVTAIAMGPSRFLKLPRENYGTIWKSNLDLIFKIQNLLSTRMGHLQDEKVLMKAPLSQKVASLLMSLLENNPDGETTLRLPLTRKEIADSVGASVESVIRIMSEWSKQGIICTNEQHINLLKIEKLIEILREH